MKSLRRIREFLSTRHGIRVISVVAAVVVWYAIRVATSNSTIVTDITLVVQPPPDWSVVDCSARTVDVAFLGTRDDLRYLNRELIKATVDGRGHENNQSFTVELGPQNINAPGNARIDFIRPAVVTVRLDREITKQVPVKVETQNLLPDGYELDKTIVTPVTVALSGPAQLLDGVESISTMPVDLDGRIRSINKRRLPLVLADNLAGVKVDPPAVTLDLGVVERSISSRFPDLPVLPMLAPGRALRVELSPDTATLTVKGRPELMNNLAAEDVRLFVDITTLSSNRAESLPIRAVLPNGITLVRTEPATVEVSLKE